MYILLINTNPVVSRLLALCTRDKEMVLEEVTHINTLKRLAYDVVFVDEESHVKEVLELDNYLSTTIKILFSNENIAISSFDMTIKKPFLPSQIIGILKNVQSSVPNSEGIHIKDEIKEEEKQHSIFPLSVDSEVDDSEEDTQEDTQVLDLNEIEKIKALLDMDEKIEPIELSDDEIEVKKIEVIKEQLIADGLEIVEEDEIIESLSTEETIQIFDIAEELFSSPVKKEKAKQKKPNKKKIFDLTKEEREQIKDAIAEAIGNLKRKKMKKLLKGKKVDIVIKLKEQK